MRGNQYNNPDHRGSNGRVRALQGRRVGHTGQEDEATAWTFVMQWYSGQCSLPTGQR